MRIFFTLLMLLGFLLGIALVVVPYPKAVFLLITTDAPSALPIPVQGVSRKAIVDSWGNPRNGGRKHKGIDIFAKRGTPVLAPVSGLVIGCWGPGFSFTTLPIWAASGLLKYTISFGEAM
jgi:hypothetical protein